MTSPPPVPRPRCPSCLRPLAQCLCADAVRVDNRTEVLILQHPLERLHAKGTARLLHLSLARSRIEVGEQFDPAELAGWVGASGAALLYPVEADEAAQTRLALPVDVLRLVVLDATWRKSRLMLHRNPVLQRLPRLALQAPPPSRYGSRRAHRPHERSTLEATVLALAALDGPQRSHDALLAALDAQVSRWQAAVPALRG